MSESFKDQVFRLREDAIVAAVNRLLSEKGFDLMTVDAVAAEVGIGKASLYKHFGSKEELGAAAMAYVLQQAIAQASLIAADTSLDDFERLVAMARWAVVRQLRGEMPALPAQNPTLRAAMLGHRIFMDRLTLLSDQLGAWIESARAGGHLDASFPAEMALYSLFAKGCDPVVVIMKESRQYSEEQIVDWSVRSCFMGLAGPARRPVAKRPASRRG